jgi:hypothetical protein
MATISPIDTIRLQIKRMGYDLIPLSTDKLPYKNWPKQCNDEASILRWPGIATGIRMFGHDVFVIDLDIRIAIIRDEILKAYTAQWPAFMARCLRRHSSGVTLALIGRLNTARRGAKSKRWFRTADDKTEKGNLVELFGGADKRQVAVEGVHSRDAGQERRYGYDGPAIWDTPIGALPWFPDGDQHKQIKIADTIMTQHGLLLRWDEKEPNVGTKIFDLTPEMVFTLSDGEQLTLAELEEDIDTLQRLNGRRVTGYATIWDPASTTPDRVLVNAGRDGLTLWDCKHDTSHRWRSRAPQPDKIAEMLKELMKAHQAKVRS